MFNPKKLKTFDYWKSEIIDQLVDNYEFDLTEKLRDFDEDKAETIETFQDYCLAMYFSYIDDLIN